MRRLLGREPARLCGFLHLGLEWAVVYIAGDTPGRRGAFFDSSTAASGENNHRAALRVIDREGKKKLPVDRDLLFHEHGFDGKLAHFHRQHARRVGAHIIRLFGKGHAADAGATGRPGLDLDHHFAAEFLGGGYSFIGRGSGAAARNLEPVRGENFLALIFVESSHGWELFPRS